MGGGGGEWLLLDLHFVYFLFDALRFFYATQRIAKLCEMFFSSSEFCLEFKWIFFKFFLFIFVILFFIFFFVVLLFWVFRFFFLEFLSAFHSHTSDEEQTKQPNEQTEQL